MNRHLRTGAGVVVLLSQVALFTVPSWDRSFFPLRPEDITGVLALACAAMCLALVGWNRRSEFARTLLAYGAWLTAVVVVHDLLIARQPLALVLYFKEASALALGYLTYLSAKWWKPYLPWVFLLNFVYVACQLGFDHPLGLYGVSPIGHELSPSGSGLWFFAAVVIGLTLSAWPLMIAGVVGVMLAGSKTALLGAVVFIALWCDWQMAMAGVACLLALGSIAMKLWAYDDRWGSLNRYSGFLHPVAVIGGRGIWDKFDWLSHWWLWVVGVGYAFPHTVNASRFSLGMAMDSQPLYYLVTGGFVAVLLAALLMLAIVRVPLKPAQHRVLVALVCSYVCMGLGAEVLQLSISGNVFWMMVGLCFADGAVV